MSVLIRWKFEIISKLVGISEAIRLILVFFELKFINSKKLYVRNKDVLDCLVNKNHVSPLPTLLLNNKCSLVFSRNMSTSVNTNCLDNNNTNSLENIAFKEWLAGLIDGDGYFLLSKNGYNSCQITMDARDKKVLYLIQHRYGGSVKQILKDRSFKYKLRNQTNLTLSLIHIWRCRRIERCRSRWSPYH